MHQLFLKQRTERKRGTVTGLSEAKLEIPSLMLILSLFIMRFYITVSARELSQLGVGNMIIKQTFFESGASFTAAAQLILYLLTPRSV
jgi:hypothetical protein